MASELRKVGAIIEEGKDYLVIDPPPTLRSATIDTYDDHRMAMSFAIAGMKIPGITIRNPSCTAKTYPRFFQDLKTLTNVG